MKRQLTICCLTLVTGVALISCSSSSVSTTGNEDPTEEDTTDQGPAPENFYRDYAIKNLPAPPEGKKWVIDEEITDEFEGDSLDKTKWGDRLPNWKGSPPTLFVPDNIWVDDGNLNIINTWLEEEIPAGNGEAYTIGAANARSKKGLIFPVYTEARMKASNIPSSSTFWLMADTSKPLSDSLRYTTELDVIETIAGPYSWDPAIESFNTKLHSNTHFRTRKPGEPETFYSQGPDELAYLGFKTHEGFHTYGVFWVDAKHAKFYVDGYEVYTIEFDNSQKSNPFDLPMHLRMGVGAYSWLPTLTKEILTDESKKRTTRFDWIRTYRLEVENNVW